MSSGLTRHRLTRLIGACLVLFAVLVAAGFWVVELESSQRSSVEDRLLASYTAEVRAELEDELYRSVNLARGLRAFVVADPSLGEPTRLEVLLSDLYTQGEHVRNIGLAPDNVLEVVYPLEGNEAAVGLRYEDLPEQLPAIERAMRIRSTVLAGPVDLVQGGRGLVNRTPVFLPDGSYWGDVSLVVDLDGLLAAVREDTADMPIVWGARAIDTGTGGGFIGGDPGVFADPDDPTVTTLSFEVPDGRWEVTARSTRDANPGLPTPVLRLLAVAVAAVVSGLVFEAVRERWRVLELSLQDPLTGLANRRRLEDRVEQAIASSRRSGEPFAVLYVDLDRFKPVNDAHGHEAGDHVLKVIADRLRERLRASDTLARVGGDEFVALLPDTDEAGAAALASELEQLVTRPIPWRSGAVTVGASAGVSMFPRDATDASALIDHADGSMYTVKQDRGERGASG